MEADLFFPITRMVLISMNNIFNYGSPRRPESTMAVRNIRWKWKLLSRVWLCHSMDYTVHGILQARNLEWVAFPFSRESSQPRDRTQISRIPAEPQGKPKNTGVGSLVLLQRIFPTQ